MENIDLIKNTTPNKTIEFDEYLSTDSEDQLVFRLKSELDLTKLDVYENREMIKYIYENITQINSNTTDLNNSIVQLKEVKTINNKVSTINRQLGIIMTRQIINNNYLKIIGVLISVFGISFFSLTTLILTTYQ